MRDHPCTTTKTRKRYRNNAVRIRERPSRTSWSCLRFLFAATSMSSRTTWAVRVDPAPISNNDSSSAETANVRGGRGERGGRAFVRQPQQQQQQSGETTTTTTTTTTNNDNYTEQHNNFLTWCRDSLGIDTSLVEIDYFDYPDYLQAMEDKIDIFYEDSKYDEDEEEDDEYNNHYLDEEDRYLSVVDEYPSIKVRGLKASQDISVGEVVLSIPHSALWTVHNAIDASGDKNLVNSMGPEARQTNGWESPGMDEIPLLAVTLLYHRMKLDNNHAPYLELLQTHNLQDSIPHLWDSRKLRKSATPSVLRVAQGIRKDVVDLYEAIVMVLIESHPDVFGIPETDDEEWMFSLEKFHWAFALINSRHWHLEIPDDLFVEEEITEAPQSTPESEELPSSNQEPANPPEDDHESFADQEGPPAATPTEEWVVIQDEKLREEEERELNLNKNGETANGTASYDHTDDAADEDYDYWPSGNSFLAPLADLLNFGPPCTRGTYNPITMAFEIVATCEFQKGQEITFWYTDACEDIFVANYGFTMPMMVPKCSKHSITTSASSSNSMKEDFLLQKQQQEQQQEYLEDELFHAYQELDRLDRRLDFLMNVLEDCHCGNQTELLEGAWDYASGETNNEEDGQDENIADAESAEKQIPLPKSPSPPTSTPMKKESKKGPDAQHAIRDGRSRKTKKSGDSTPEVHRHRHRRHGSMTRFRSRRNHQGRRVEHEF